MTANGSGQRSRLHRLRPGPVLIDEFQHVPEILDAIKAELNTDTRPGRYVLTGPTRYSVLPQAAQSLTGRAHVINVLPLSQGELHGRRENFVDQLWADPARLPEIPSRQVTRDELPPKPWRTRLCCL